MNTDEDYSIIQKCLDGDSKAYEFIIKKYQLRIINLCYRYTKNREDAEEVAQEAFYKAYISLEKFRFESKFYSWLHRISINTALNFINSKEKTKEKQTFSENSGLNTLESVNRSNEETPYNLYNMEKLAIVIDGIYNKLDKDLQLVIKLRDIDDHSYDEIAIITEMPIGTVRSKLHRARELLTKELKKHIDNE